MADMVQAGVILVTEETIKDKIYAFRGQKVMLDFDLAELYGYETRYLNQQVGRNSEKFEGDDFMFQLTDEEFHDLMLQNVTSRYQVTLIGRASGGGSCAIQFMSTASGTTFSVSSPMRFNFSKNGVFYDSDRGVEPDVYIRDMSRIYDRQYMNTVLDGIH